MAENLKNNKPEFNPAEESWPTACAYMNLSTLPQRSLIHCEPTSFPLVLKN